MPLQLPRNTVRFDVEDDNVAVQLNGRNRRQYNAHKLSVNGAHIQLITSTYPS